MKPIPQPELDQAHDEMLLDACHSMAKVLFIRCKSNPKKGLQYLSNVATYLDCRLGIKMEIKK